MRLQIFYNPRLLLERLAEKSRQRWRLSKLKQTSAASLALGHIDSLELLEQRRNKPPKVVYDIGANIGTWSLLAKAVFPLAEVHAFEPLPRHVTEFTSRTARIHGIHLHPVALGASRGVQTMRVASFSDASSLLEIGSGMAEEFNVREAAEEPVIVERLDDYVAANGLSLPDLIKLDVQGYELEVIRGAQKCLQNATAVITEVSFVEFYSRQCFFEDVVTVLAEYGFRAHALGVNTPLGKPLRQTDILFHRVGGTNFQCVSS